MPPRCDSNRGIMEHINPRKLASPNRDARNGVISGCLRDACNANEFIADLFIMDYGERAVFLASGVASLDISLDCDCYRADSFGEGVVNHGIKVLPNHIPNEPSNHIDDRMRACAEHASR